MKIEISAKGPSVFTMSMAHTRDLWETETSQDWIVEETVRRFAHDLIRIHGRVPMSMSIRIFAFKDEDDIFEWNADYRRRLIEDYRSPRDHPDLEKVLAAMRMREVLIEITAVTEPLRITTIREGSLAKKEDGGPE